MIDELKTKQITDTVKVNKNRSSESVKYLNGIKGVTAEEQNTDEFDIPPTSILKVKVGLEVLDTDLADEAKGGDS